MAALVWRREIHVIAQIGQVPLEVRAVGENTYRVIHEMQAVCCLFNNHGFAGPVATSQWSGQRFRLWRVFGANDSDGAENGCCFSTDALNPKRNPVSSRAVTAGLDESSGPGIILGTAGKIEDSGSEAHLIDPVCKDHRGYVLSDSHETVTVADLVGVHDIIPLIAFEPHTVRSRDTKNP